jgi:hypothetical protein
LLPDAYVFLSFVCVHFFLKLETCEIDPHRIAVGQVKELQPGIDRKHGARGALPEPLPVHLLRQRRVAGAKQHRLVRAHLSGASIEHNPSAQNKKHEWVNKNVYLFFPIQK